MFITIEGMDGSGKTTAIVPIKECLESLGYKVLLTREPGGHKVSEKIRKVILDDDSEGMHPWTEALLYIASRKEHMDKVVAPALQKGYVVISDRFMDSTSAYQGNARGLGISKVNEIQEIVLDGCIPDLTIYFDLNMEEAERRINKRPELKNRLDREGLNFKLRVKEGYDELIRKNPDRIKVIDANLGIEEVQQQTKKIIVEAIAKWQAKN
ncbi:dTMP kinase [Mesoplasma syrphidae]|uniref:Thymidylate kinase n=1 Tax=Mesoplasma syrphidae TaxID=225999 RepID=A0A2K9BL04_9MOLU|nr:dTMP kinase [Mesoplasma syrphidae]AUF83906.1 dTMP kinase [Mesoplasma syrphidae]